METFSAYGCVCPQSAAGAEPARAPKGGRIEPADVVITCMSKACGWPVAMCGDGGFVHGGVGVCMNPEDPHGQVLCAHCDRFVNQRNFGRLGHAMAHQPHSQGRQVPTHRTHCEGDVGSVAAMEELDILLIDPAAPSPLSASPES